jgi:hypothetical protein
MPLYMDVHQRVEGLTAQAVAGAHQRDLEVQAQHGVNYLRYWFDEGSGKVFCLVEAPSKRGSRGRASRSSRPGGGRDYRGPGRHITPAPAPLW